MKLLYHLLSQSRQFIKVLKNSTIDGAEIENGENDQEADVNSDASVSEADVPESVNGDEVVSDNTDEAGEPQIAEPPITPVVANSPVEGADSPVEAALSPAEAANSPVEGADNDIQGAQPTERSMLSDFAADLNGLSHSNEEPADPSIVVVPDDYHPESPLNVAEASEMPFDASQAVEDSLQSSDKVPIETDQTSNADPVSESDSDIAQAFPEVPNDVAEPTPEDVKTPEQLADINLADQIDGFENLSPEQKQLIEQYVKIQLVSISIHYSVIHKSDCKTNQNKLGRRR